MPGKLGRYERLLPLISLRRIAPIDLALGAAAAAFGSVTLTFPFGRDPALFFYIGREWALRGCIPYRDVYENEPRFIHALHALLVALAGEARSARTRAPRSSTIPVSPHG